MVTSVEVCNRALAKIGTRTTLQSLTETSAEGVQCNLIYASTVDEILSMAFWNFGRETAALALNKAAPGTPENTAATTSSTWLNIWPPPPWTYEYYYPADCLQARYVTGQPQQGTSVPIFSSSPFPFVNYNQTGPVKFIVASGTSSASASMRVNVIDTFAQNALLTYTVRITDLNLWSAQAIEALVYALAAKLAITLTGSRELSNDLFTLANGVLLQARSTDGNEGLTIQDFTPDWIALRNDAIAYPQGVSSMAYLPLYTVS